MEDKMKKFLELHNSVTGGNSGNTGSTQNTSQQTSGGSGSTGSRKKQKISEFQAMHNQAKRIFSVTGKTDGSEDFVFSFLRDSQDYLRDSVNNLNRLTWSIANDPQKISARTTAAENMRQRAADVRYYLEENKSDIDPDRYNYFMSYLKDFGSDMFNLSRDYENRRSYFNQFENENDWQWFEKYQGNNSDTLLDMLDGMEDVDEKSWLQNYTAQVYHQELPDVDIEASRRKAESLQGLLDNYRKTKSAIHVSTDTRAQEWIAEIDDKYGGEEGLERAISRENQRINLATRTQNNAANEKKFNAVTQQPDFVKYSAFDPNKTELGYRYINGSTGDRLDLEQQYGQYATDFGKHGWDSLTNDEKAIYNYYMNTGDRDSAAEYLRYIEETAQIRKGQSTDAYLDSLAESTSDWEKLSWMRKIPRYAFEFYSGWDQHETDMRNLGNMISGNEDFVPNNATQVASSLVREDLSEDGPMLPEWMGGVSLGQAAGDLISTSGNMMPSRLVSGFIGMIAGPTGSKLTNGLMMGGAAAGGAYQDMINAGYSKDQARLYGLLVGGFEGGLEAMLGGISSMGGGGIQKITKWVSNLDNALLNFAARFGGSMVSEGIEEGLQEWISGWLKSEITKEDFWAKPADVIYSSLLGAASGGLFEGPSIISDVRNQSKSGRQVIDAEGVDSLKSLGATSANADTQKLAGRITSDSSPFAVGNLLKQVQSDVTERNASDISKSLTQKGMPEKTAKQYGQMLSNMLEFGSATEIQRTVMESDPIIGQTLREMQMPSSSVYQRTHSMNTATGKELSLDRVAAAYGKQAEAVKQTYALGETEPGKNIPVNDFAYGFQRAYTLGREGAKESALTDEIAPGLNQSQRKLAYDIGRSAVAAEKAAASKRVSGESSTVHILNEDGSVGDEVQISEIASISGNNVTYKLTDGRTASEDQLSFSGDNAVMDTVKDLGLDVETANVVLKASMDGSLAGESMVEGVEESYRYGKYGYSLDVLNRTKAGRSIPETVRSAVYQSAKKQAEQTRKQTGKPGKVSVTEKKGEVTFNGDREKLSKVQRTSLEGLEWIAEVTGAKIYIESPDGKDGALGDKNGWYDTKDDSIHIYLNAGQDGTGTLLYTAAHEFVHRMKENSPARFQRLAGFLVSEYVKHGVDVDALVKEQQRQSLEAGVELSYDEAFEEMVADAMEAMFTDSKAVEKLGRLKAQDKSLWREIKDFVLGLSRKIRSIYARLKPDSAEARYVLKMKDSIDQLAKMFAEGIIDTGAEKNTTGEGGVKHQARRSKRITMAMTDSERTEILKGKVITAEVYEGQADKAITDSRHDLESHKDTLIKSALVKIGEEFGVFTDYSISDVDIDIRLSRGNLKESVSKKIDPVQIAKLMPVLKTAVENAVGVECHANRYFFDNDTVMFENLLGGYVDGTFFVPVRFGLKHSVSGKATLYLIVDQEKIDVKKIKAEVAKATAVQKDRPKTSHSAFNISLASIVPFVNGKDLLRYLPDNMLNNLQKEAKYEAIAETIVYTNDKNDRKYAEYIRTGKLSSAKQMIEKAAKVAGYSNLFFHGAKKGGGFTEFRNWSYFTENKNYAERYAQRDNPSSLYTVFVKMSMPFDTRDLETKSLFEDIRDEYGLSEIQESGLPDWTDGYDIADYINENDLEYDSIILDEGGDLVNGKPVSRGLSYVVRNSEQIKSADVISYDDNGNIIPISQRFDTSKKDIRYSLRKKQPSLEAQNKKLQEDVNRLRELLKLQGKVTKGTKFKSSSVEAAARYLKGKFNVGGNTKELAQKLNGFYEYIATDKELTWDSLKDQAASIVDWMLENEKFQRSQYAQEILDSMKGRRFALDEKQRAEVEYRHGSYGAYQKLTRGMVSSNAEISLDSFWQEMAAEYPGIFDSEISSSDMPQALLDVLEQLEGMEDMDFAMDWRMKEQAMLQDVYDSYWRVDTLHTVADKNQKQINELKGRHFQKMLELRQTHAQEVQKLKDARKQNTESRGETAIRNKIKRVVKELEKILLRGSRKRNVKAGMRSMVEDAIVSANILFTNDSSNEELLLSGIQTDLTEEESKLLNRATDLMDQIAAERVRLGSANEAAESNYAEVVDHSDSVTAAAAAETAAGLYAQTNRRKLNALEKEYRHVMKSLSAVFERERSRRNSTTISEVLQKLADSYGELQKSEYSYLKNAYSDGAYAYLDRLKDEVKGTLIRDMNRDQLQKVYEAYKVVLTTIQTANRMFNKEKAATVQEYTDAACSEMRSNGIRQKDLPEKIQDTASWLNNFSWQNLRPVDAFRRTGSKKMMELFWDFVDGMAQRGKMTAEIRDFLVKARKDTSYQKFDLNKAETFTTVDGKKMKLTLTEKMSIYAYSKREAAFDHMTEGGFTYAKAQKYVDEKGVTRYHNNAGGTWRLTLDDLQKICASLTENQRRYVDIMQKFLTEFGHRGNAISRDLFGIDLFKEENYFPLMSNHDYLNSVQTDLGATQTAASLKNSGFTKSTTPHANNPIVLKSFDDVCMEHLDKMMNYIALTLPLENLRKVYDNVSVASAETKPQSTKALIGAVYGEEAKQYFEQFLKDANGNHGSNGAKNPLWKMFSRSKATAVSANFSVVIQQISSVFRASVEISPVHLIWARNYGKGTIRGKKSYQEMMEHTGLATIKAMGGFDVGSNRGLNDYIGLEEAPRSKEKVAKWFQDFFSMGAEYMDKVGWTMIWNAVKREVASRKQYEINSDAFFHACEQRFNEIIVKTQVFDSVLSKSGFMRSDNDGVKYLTSFMGEPTVTAGMVFNTHLEVARAIKSKNNVGYSVRKLLRTDGALLVTLLLNGMLKAIPYAMRDDEEDESFWERWIKHLGENIRGDLNPLNLLPIARDISSIVQGRTVERPDLALLADLFAVGQRAVEVLTDEEKQEEMSAEDFYDLAKDLVGAIGNFSGLPVQNIWRDVESYLRLWKDATDGIEPVEMGESFRRGWSGDEETKYEGLYDAISSGDTARVEALRATYNSDDSYHSAVRKALREHDPRIQQAAQAYFDGDFLEYDRIKTEIVEEGNFDYLDVNSAIKSEITKLEDAAKSDTEVPKEEKQPPRFTVEEYYISLRDGNTKAADTIYDYLYQRELDEGYLRHQAESNVKSALVSQIKGAYLDEEIPRADALKLLKSYTDKGETEVKKWDFEIETGYSWGARARGYYLGDIPKNELIAAVMDIEGESREGALAYIDFLDLAKGNEDFEISAAQADSYFEHAEPAGIKVDIWLDYRKQASAIQGDKDADGKTISGSRKNKLLDVINALPISPRQKDAIYLAEGWAESKLYEAPWH